MEAATPKGEKALAETTVFNPTGMLGSSWPSCLLSGVDAGGRPPICVIILFSQGGEGPFLPPPPPSPTLSGCEA